MKYIEKMECCTITKIIYNLLFVILFFLHCLFIYMGGCLCLDAFVIPKTQNTMPFHSKSLFISTSDMFILNCK